jgi:hypothetical protein
MADAVPVSPSAAWSTVWATPLARTAATASASFVLLVSVPAATFCGFSLAR